jgi:hypothetical protein
MVIDSGTELIVFLMRKDSDPTIVPIGGSFYIEFDGNGKMKDVYTNDIFYSNTRKHYMHEGDTIGGVLHRHSIDDPLLNPADICTIMLNKESITWEEFVTISPYNNTTYLASTYNLIDHTLTISEDPTTDYDPQGNIYYLTVICGDKSFSIRSDEHGFQQFRDVLNSINLHVWTNKINRYDSGETQQKYPEMSAHPMVEMIIREGRCERLPEEIKNRLE